MGEVVSDESDKFYPEALRIDIPVRKAVKVDGSVRIPGFVILPGKGEVNGRTFTFSVYTSGAFGFRFEDNGQELIVDPRDIVKALARAEARAEVEAGSTTTVPALTNTSPSLPPEGCWKGQVVSLLRGAPGKPDEALVGVHGTRLIWELLDTLRDDGTVYTLSSFVPPGGIEYPPGEKRWLRIKHVTNYNGRGKATTYYDVSVLSAVEST